MGPGVQLSGTMGPELRWSRTMGPGVRWSRTMGPGVQLSGTKGPEVRWSRTTGRGVRWSRTIGSYAWAPVEPSPANTAMDSRTPKRVERIVVMVNLLQRFVYRKHKSGFRS